ncbi:hypothetical protein M0R45_026248 [Rubus argutus]|uniref:Uncharacterized protein n=1 Tax=Rubus argutus TaxID=59490 RepID=A0AAW1WYN0_RUBAR
MAAAVSTTREHGLSENGIDGGDGQFLSLGPWPSCTVEEVEQRRGLGLRQNPRTPSLSARRRHCPLQPVGEALFSAVNLCFQLAAIFVYPVRSSSVVVSFPRRCPHQAQPRPLPSQLIVVATINLSPSISSPTLPNQPPISGKAQPRSPCPSTQSVVPSPLISHPLSSSQA